MDIIEAFEKYTTETTLGRTTLGRVHQISCNKGFFCQWAYSRHEVFKYAALDFSKYYNEGCYEDDSDDSMDVLKARIEELESKHTKALGRVSDLEEYIQGQMIKKR